MTAQTLTSPTDGLTERFDPTACLDERMRLKARRRENVEPGFYVEVDGPHEALLIPLGAEAMRIGRGLGAELHFDESSVSRRHAIVVPRPSGAQILDDRSANGTFVNGRRIQQAELHDGDVIVIGRVTLRYLEL
jgi:pSer/pThr/pTyr-binding forkhead associated (FHA) protein